MNDITDILRELLDRYSNTPELDMEFERMMREDKEFVEELKAARENADENDLIYVGGSMYVLAEFLTGIGYDDQPDN